MNNVQAIVAMIKFHLLRHPKDAHLITQAACSNSKPTPVIIPTKEMINAGNDVIQNISEATFNIRMYGLDETKTLNDYVPDNYTNKDLILAYLRKEIDLTVAIYLAMTRSK